VAKANPPKRQVAVKRKPSPSQPQRQQAASAVNALRPRLWRNEDAYQEVADSPYFRDTLGVTAPVVSRKRLNYTMGSYNPDEKTIYFNPVHDPDETDASLTPAGVRTAKNVLTHEGAHFLENTTPNAFPSYFAVNRPGMSTQLPENRSSSVLSNKPLEKVTSHKFSDGNRGYTTFDLKSNVVTEEKPRFFGLLGVKNVDRQMTPSERNAIQALDRYYAFGGENLLGDALVTYPGEAFAQAYTNAAGFLSETAGDTTGFREKLGRYEGNTPGAGAIVRDLLTARPIYRQHPLRGVIR
jgi:hypothetical protein